MKSFARRSQFKNLHLFLATALVFGINATAADLYVSPLGGHVFPFTSWPSAATNIQAAIDAASAGDTVWVTNGTFSSGTKTLPGNMKTRVVVDKPLKLRSVNGAAATTIRGAYDPQGTLGLGPNAVRCAWMTNGALIDGFTLMGGATVTSGVLTNVLCGAGIWCSGTNAFVINCLIISNSATANGGGVYQGTISNSSLTANSASSGGDGGGGIAFGNLIDCAISGNSAFLYGGGAIYSTLNRCTLVNNTSTYGGAVAYSSVDSSKLLDNFAGLGGGGAYSTLRNCTLTRNLVRAAGGGAYSCLLTNCIIYFNYKGQATDASVSDNYYQSTFSHCCASPSPPGDANFDLDPRFLADHAHLALTSPCVASGLFLPGLQLDIDKQPWQNPPSIGCDEWHPEPVFIIQPHVVADGSIGDLVLGFAIAGQEPFNFSWLKNGTALARDSHYLSPDSTNLVLHALSPSDAGDYFAMVSNSSSIATSEKINLTIRCVDPYSAAPAPPFTNWLTAAATIQEAIDAANPGDVILAANGCYSNSTAGSGTAQRLNVNKAVTVMKVAQPGTAIITGLRDLVGHGARSLSCVFLGEGACLNGFVLANGDARGPNAGGVFCPSTNATLLNCMITNNHGASGGGAYEGTFKNCTFEANQADWEGGACFRSVLQNCVLRGNTAFTYGGACSSGQLVQCTLDGNSSAFGGATAGATLSECVLTSNSASQNGGAAYESSLTQCTLQNNKAGHYGGGASVSILFDCLLVGNSAEGGGGAYGGKLRNCRLMTNSAHSGGAVLGAELEAYVANSLLIGNTATYGGGTLGYTVSMQNCTIVRNQAQVGGGAYDGQFTSCIIWNNTATNSLISDWANNPQADHCCSQPLMPGIGNMAVDPQLVDGMHLAVASQCRGAGNPANRLLTDIDGEMWANPPSIGCDEVWESELTGPLFIEIQPGWMPAVVGHPISLTAKIDGRASRLQWTFDDSIVISNANWFVLHSWTNAGDHSVQLTAYNNDNPLGRTTNLVVQVVPLAKPSLASSMQSNNVFQLNFNAQGGVSYQIDSATNLTPPIIWQPFTNFVSEGGSNNIQDGTLNDASRFYRLSFK